MWINCSSMDSGKRKPDVKKAEGPEDCTISGKFTAFVIRRKYRSSWHFGGNGSFVPNIC